MLFRVTEHRRAPPPPPAAAHLSGPSGDRNKNTGRERAGRVTARPSRGVLTGGSIISAAVGPETRRLFLRVPGDSLFDLTPDSLLRGGGNNSQDEL